MTDLRRKIGKKTVSSAKNSRHSSRANSRSSSRANSEDEGISDGDWSVASNETLDSVTGDVESVSRKYWDEDLLEAVDGLVEKKVASVQGREELLTKVVRIMSLQYANQAIAGKERDVTEASLRSLRAGKTERENSLAARTLAILAVTSPSFGQLYDMTAPSLRNVITNAASVTVKRAALLSLASVAFFCASGAETGAVLEFLVDAILSDGHTIGAGDDEGAVISAIEAYSFLLTSIRDPEESLQESMPALVDHLESVDVGVRMAAGEAIAVIYELDEEAKDEEQGRHAPYDNIHHLTTILAQLSTASTKKLSKSHRRTQHSTFRDVLATVSDPHSDAPYSTLKFGRSIYAVDTWTKYHRIQMLRRILTHGFHIHFARNSAVRECLEHEGAVAGDSSDESDGDSLAGNHELRSRYNKEMKRLHGERVKSDRARSGKGIHREWGNGYEE